MPLTTVTNPVKAGSRYLSGNDAAAEGAIAAGCRYYGGYPITPSSEIMEYMSRELVPRGGAFMQMEDEIASISSVVGASWSGAKAMTATSGPGLSLMQECLGYAAFTETPVEGVNWAKRSTFGQPLNEADYQTPRTFRFSVGFRF